MKPIDRGSTLPEPQRARLTRVSGRWGPATGTCLAVLLATSAQAPVQAQNVVGAMNELAPFCLGTLCLGMSLEEARVSMKQLELVDRLQPEALCQGGRFRDVTAVANPRGEASVAAQFRRYAGAGGLEVQYRLWSISLTEAMVPQGLTVPAPSAAPGSAPNTAPSTATPLRRMSPADLDRLREGVTQRYLLRPTRDPGNGASRGPSVEGNLWMRALSQWQLGVTTQYNPMHGSSIILYALAEGDMAEWYQTQPGCDKPSPEGRLQPGQRPPAGSVSPPATTPHVPTPAPAPRVKPPPADWQRGTGT